MKQTLMFPDPRPLVERFGAEFFRLLPENPGVYLMRDAEDQVLYVGKARNLRKRLGSYRVANPDRMARRHLRLLRAVTRIELQLCPDETAALARESALLRELRPRYNRAGTWKGPDRLFGWRLLAEPKMSSPPSLQFAVIEAGVEGWDHAQSGAALWVLRDCLARLLWCATHPRLHMVEMPRGWFRGRHGERTVITVPCPEEPVLRQAARMLEQYFSGAPAEFTEWLLEQTATQDHPFEVAARDLDLEFVTEWIARSNKNESEISVRITH